MPAPRARIRKNWPTGLYSGKSNGTIYYRWLDPRSGKYVGLGRDFETARQAAVQKNGELMKSPVQRLLDKMEGGVSNLSWQQAADDFLAVAKARSRGRGGQAKPISKETLDAYAGYCRRIVEHFGPKNLFAKTTLRELAAYLDSYEDKARARKYARGLLVQIYDVAVAGGHTKHNLANDTLDLGVTVNRRRLTIEQLDALVAVADPWFAAACRFALYCDQRRGDVTTIEVSAYNAVTGHLVVEQEKTGNVVLAKAGPKLQAAITECLAIPPSRSKTIIRKPGRMEPVSDDMLTRYFGELRDSLIDARHKAWKMYQPFKPKEKGDKPKDGRPSWHELRSLGAHLAEQSNKSDNIAGHASEAMKRLYQSGHKKLIEAESL